MLGSADPDPYSSVFTVKNRRVGATFPSENDAAQDRRNPRVLLMLAGLLIVARLAVAAVSWGTNDAFTFYHFGQLVDRFGLIDAYRQDRELNHPPIPTLWTWAAYRMSGGASEPSVVPQTSSQPTSSGIIERPAVGTRWFSFVFKLPVILADAVTAWLLFRIWLPRAGPYVAASAAAAWAGSPCAILVSGYHCNTDPIYAMLTLLAVDLMSERRQRFFLGGLALAAAINVKLVPVLLIPPLLLSCRNWREAARFIGGLSLGVLPFIPLIVQLGPRFYQNVLAYNSNLDRWGVSFLLMLAMPKGGTPAAANPPIGLYFANARYLILALIGVWSLIGFWLRRWSRYELAAVTLAIFLVITAGFGAQYAVIPLPLLFATRPRFAAAYGIVAGAFLAAAYYMTWDGGSPLYSYFKGPLPMRAAVIGFAAWGMLVAFIVVQLVVNRAGRANPLPD